MVLAKLLTVLILLLALNAVAAAADNDGCSNATLKGDYGFTIQGDQLNPDGTTSPIRGVAITHFDGAGKLTQTDFVLTAGVPLPSNGNALTGFHFSTGETGTYKVDPDCTAARKLMRTRPFLPGFPAESLNSCSS